MEFTPKGWYRGRSLPHFDTAATQFITYRLHGSLPKAKLSQIEEEVANQPKHLQHEKRFYLVEDILDRAYGEESLLADPRVAKIVQENFLHHAGKKYELHGWVIMPNHVHILITPMVHLDSIVHSWKGYTAFQTNHILKRQGQLWQKEYFDRFIRNERQFVEIVDYIHHNPVKAGLCNDPKEWTFSSAWLENSVLSTK